VGADVLASARRQKLPAFGRELTELRRRGLVPNPPEVRVAIDSWEWARGRTRVVIAPDADPSTLDFSFVAGLDVLVGWWPAITARERRDAAIRSILRGLPRRLLVLQYGQEPAILWVKSQSVGIELAEFM
jgi:hypothetical protein